MVAAIAGLAFVAAGVVVAVHPVAIPSSHEGAFGVPAQLLSVLALCAVLSVVIVEEHRPTWHRIHRGGRAVDVAAEKEGLGGEAGRPTGNGA